MRTRNSLFLLFALLVAVPIGAAIYLGTVGLAKERGMLVDVERRSILHSTRNVRDAFVRQMQAVARAGEQPTVDEINRDFLYPGAPRAVLGPLEKHIRRVQLIPNDPREKPLRADRHGLPEYVYLVPYPGRRDPGGPVAVPDGYTLAFDVGPSSSLARTLDAAGEQVQWILWVTAVVVVLGLLFAWRAVQAEARLAERKAEFVSAVSHELRTPLTSIRMYADMLKEGWVGDRESAADYCDLISSESERLARLVNNVLDFSRLEKGDKEFDMRIGDPTGVIADTVETLRPYLREKGFELSFAAPDSLPACAFDKDAITQILVNLIDNAVKYGAVKQGESEVRVEALAENGEVILRVLDRGPGVPAAEREQIFEAFQRGANAKSGGGSGLGLALVTAYARAHKGRVEVGDRDGGGAIFALRLPAA